MRKLMLLVALLCAQTLVFAAGITYYSQGTGSPNTVTNWNTVRGGGGSSPADFTGGDIFVIQNTHTMTPTVAWTLTGTGAKLWIENGGKLISDFPVTLPNAATSTFQIDNGGTYIHNNTSAWATTIFTTNCVRTFGASSTVEIQKTATTLPTQSSYGNLTINFQADPTQNVNFSGNLTTVNGTLTIQNTSVRDIRFSNGTSTVNINNLVVSGGTLVTQAAAGTTTANVTGTTTINGGTLVMANANGTGILNTAALTMSSGTLNFASGTSTGSGTVNTTGTFNHTGGSITLTSTGVASGTLGFTGSSNQAVTVTGSPFSVTTSTRIGININNAAGITLTGNLSAVVGGSTAADVTMTAGAVTGTGNITYTGTGTGGTRLIYASNYTAGAGEWPSASGPTHVTVNSGVTLTLPASFTRTVSGTLNLAATSTLLDLGGNTLTVGTGTTTATAGTLSLTGYLQNGTLRKWFTTTLSNTKFPFGSIALDRSLTVNSGTLSAGGTIAVSYVPYTGASPYTTAITPYTDNNVTIDLQSKSRWVVTAGNGLTLSTLVFFVGTSSFGSMGSYSNVRLITGTSSAGTAGTNTTGSVVRTVSNATDLSNTWYLGGNSADNNFEDIYTAVTGSVNWSSPSSWTVNGVAATTIPGAVNQAIIPTGSFMTLDGSGASYSALAVSMAGTATLSTGSNNLTLTGTLATAGTGTLTVGGGTLTAGYLTQTAATTINVTSGTFNLTSTSTAQDPLSMSAGAFNISGGSLNITGASGRGISQTGGTVTVSAGTLTLGPAGGGNRTWAGSGGSFAINNTGTVNVNGNLSLSATAFNMASAGSALNIDGNDGTLAGSASSNLFSLGTGSSGTVNGGTITIVDPPYSGSSNNALTFAATNGNLSWAGNTLVLGGSTGTNSTTATNGFTLECFGNSSHLALGNVTVNGGNTTDRFVAAGSELNINGTLTVNSGSAFRDKAGSGTLNVGGNIVNNGTITIQRGLNLRGYSAAAAIANVNTQSIAGSGSFESSVGGADGRVAALLVNNSNASGITLGMDLGVSGTLTMTLGRVSLSNNNFTMGSAASFAGNTLSATNFFVVTGTGQFKRIIPASAATSYVFPIGTFGTTYNYTPVSLTFTSNSVQRTIGARVTANAHPNNADFPGAAHSVARYWSFTNDAAGTYDYSAAFTYSTATPNDLVSGSTATSVKASYWDGAVWNLITGSSTTSPMVSSGTLNQSGGPLAGTDWTGRTPNSSTFTWTGATSTDWSAASNWDLNSVPNGILANVIIPSVSNNPAIGSSTSIAVGTLTVNSGATLSLGASANLTISDVVTYNGAADFDPASTVTFASTSNAQSIPALNYGSLALTGTAVKTLASSGTIGVAGSYSVSGTAPTTTGSTINYNGSGTQNIGAATYNNLTIIDRNGQVTFPGGTVAIAGTFTPASGSATYAMTGNTIDFSAATAQTIPAFNYNIITNTGNGARTLAASGTIGIATSMTAGSGTYTTTGSTVDYNGNGAQTINSLSFYNLTISGARTTNNVTFGATTGVANVFNPAATFTSGVYNTTSNTNVFTFNGSGAQNVPAMNYRSITLSGARGGATITFTGTIGISLTFTNSTTSATLNFAGSTINYNSTSATQTILGGVTYDNLTVSGTNSNSKTTSAGFNVSGTLTYSNSGTGSLRINNTTTPRTFNVNHLVITAGSIDGGNQGSSVMSTINLTGDLTIGATGYMTVTGLGTAELYLAGTGTQNINITSGAYLQYWAAYGSGTGTVTLNSELPINGLNGELLRVGTGQTFVAGTNQVTTNTTGSVFTVNGTVKTANQNGLYGSTSSTFSSTNSPTITINTGSTVEYNGTSTQSVTAANYHNLSISNNRGGAAITMPSGTVGVGGTFAVPATNYTVVNAGNTVNFSSASSQTIPGFAYRSITNTGNGARVLDALGSTNIDNVIHISSGFAPGSGTYTVTGSKIDYKGTAGMTLTTFTYNDMEISGDRAGGTVSFGAGTITVGGAFTWSATNVTQAAGTGTFVYSGTGQTIAALNYNNLTLSGSGTTFTSGTTGIAGVFNPGSNATIGIGTIDYNGTGAQTITAANYNNLSLSGGSTKTLGGTASTVNLAIAGGTTFAGSSNTLSLTGDWTNSGIFSAGTSTINFNGSGARAYTNTNAAQVFNIINVNKNGTLSLGNTISVGSKLGLLNGALNGGGNITIANGAGITRSAGSLDATPIFSGVVDVSYSNSSTLTSGYEIPANNTVRNLSMNSSADVQLTSNLTATGTFTLTSGKLDIGSNRLTANAGSITGGSSASYVKTSGAASSFLVKGVTVATQFPVGSSTYNPVTITPSATYDWGVRVIDALSADPGFNTNGALLRQWDITPYTGGVEQAEISNAASVAFQFDENDPTIFGSTYQAVLANASPNNNVGSLQPWHYYLGAWVKHGSAVGLSGTAGGTRTITVGGLTRFSPYAVSMVGSPLPVQLLTFSGKRVNSRNELKWTTASESNNRGFEVERSLDGRSYTGAGFVASRAQGGNSTSELAYSFFDNAATGSTWYYRLKQVDLDGRYKYSPVVKLTSEKSGLLVVDGVYPNPAKGSLQVRLQAGQPSGNIVLQLSDIQGRVVKVKGVSVEAGAATTTAIDIEQLAAGVYHLKAVSVNGEVSETIKVVKQ